MSRRTWQSEKRQQDALGPQVYQVAANHARQPAEINISLPTVHVMSAWYSSNRSFSSDVQSLQKLIQPRNGAELLYAAQGASSSPQHRSVARRICVQAGPALFGFFLAWAATANSTSDRRRRMTTNTTDRLST